MVPPELARALLLLQLAASLLAVIPLFGRNNLGDWVDQTPVAPLCGEVFFLLALGLLLQWRYVLHAAHLLVSFPDATELAR